MEHIESSIKVFYTKEYSRFRMINGNRQLNESKIKNIIADIDKGVDVLRYCPILVKQGADTLDIIDGQHRYYVARKKKTCVWYILVEEMTLHNIARINSNTEKWKAKDFINCYIQLENKNYVVLRDILDSFSLSITDAISLLEENTVQSGGRQRDKFEQGEFVAKYESKTKEFLSIVSKFNFYAKYSRPFLIAVSKVIEGKKITVADLINKVNTNFKDLEKQSNYKDYLLNLESIYNKGKQSRVVIY